MPTPSAEAMPGLDPPEGMQVGMPGPDGFYIDASIAETAVPPEAQRIYDVVRDYHDTIQAAYGDDIMEHDAENEAWQETADIAMTVEMNPDIPLTDRQLDLLAAVESHSATFKATSTLNSEQMSTLNGLDEMSAGGIVREMARDRYDRWRAAPAGTEQKDDLHREWTELKDYQTVLDDTEFGVAGIGSAVEAYRNGEADPALNEKAHLDIKSNAYFAKYATEIVGRATSKSPESAPAPVEAAEDSLSHEEKVAQAFTEEVNNVYDDPNEVVSEVRSAKDDFENTRLKTIRENYPEDSSQRMGAEREAIGFADLQELAEQWRADKESGKTTQNFADYMAGLHEAAEAEVEQSVEEADGKLSDERAKHVGKVQAAYRAGWSNSYGLNGRIRRRVYPKAIERARRGA